MNKETENYEEVNFHRTVKSHKVTCEDCGKQLISKDNEDRMDFHSRLKRYKWHGIKTILPRYSYYRSTTVVDYELCNKCYNKRLETRSK